MHFRLRTALGVAATLILAAGLAIQGCQDQTAMESLGPDLASVVRKTLKVSGGGTGSGVVTAPAVGGAPALDCAISGGTYDPTDCNLLYAKNTLVTLTATASPGSAFKEWRNGCTGSNPTCSVRMDVNRSVRAVFRRTSSTVSYRLNVTGAGDGNGTVTSQAGLTPAIACDLHGSGSPSGTCSATYTSGTSVTLTAVAPAGHTFTGWSGDCTGTGTCSLTMGTNRSVTAGFTAPLGAEAEVGRWSAPEGMPIVGLHLSLLKSGNALLWGHGGEAQVWNASGGSFTQVANTVCNDPLGCELFCSGHTILSDGRVMVAGGHDEVRGNNYGIRQSSIFDGTSWQPAGLMNYPRWYPTLVTLADGGVLALSGNQVPGTTASIPERWNQGTWTALTGANFELPTYPRAFVEPKAGLVFVTAGQPSRFLDPSGTGSWTLGPSRLVNDRSYGGAVMLDSKVLFAGGGGRNCPNTPARTAEIIDLADAAPTWRSTGSMANARRHINLVALPDGTALATGGTSTCGPSDEAGAVFAAELWDPATEQWRTLASAGVVRVYHSTAILLPDGRVLSMGSGDGGGVTNQRRYEIFSPPYLFKGNRPSYDLAGGPAMHYGQSFTVSTGDAASIRKVTIIRLPSTTHAFDMSQRLNTLSFTVAGDGLSITPPAAGRIAPPGPYMLFLVNEAGVPSVAQIVTLSD
ncbi:MAG TPA: galactose oxidase-like domain-containing protein [Gemmatimonadales bacterium]|jgi:uncharacterized repeat protein (TIGR02543 family)